MHTRIVLTFYQYTSIKLRAAALAMYSQIQHARRVAGHSTEMPVPLPEYLIEPEDAHLLVPFTNPGANCVNHNTT